TIVVPAIPALVGPIEHVKAVTTRRPRIVMRASYARDDEPNRAPLFCGRMLVHCIPPSAPARGIDMEDAAAIVIGSGAFGASTAYHLARRGAKVILVDQHALGSQTSPRAAGLTSKADRTPVMAQLRHEACDAFERFETEMGVGVDFHR